jgi:hypothetical protein
MIINKKYGVTYLVETLQDDVSVCDIAGISVKNEYRRGIVSAWSVKAVNDNPIPTGDKNFFQLRNVAGKLKCLIQFVREVDKFALKESQYNKTNKIEGCERYNSFHW